MRQRSLQMILDKDAKPVPFVCMYPLCDNNPIRTHSVSRAWLKYISDDNNRVVVLRHNHETLFDEEAFNTNMKPEVTKFGIYSTKKLSTCYCFCARHDVSVFRDVDNVQEFDISRKSAFLLAYRSISHEICVRRRILAIQSDLSVPKHSVAQWELHKSNHAFALECIVHTHRNMQDAILNDSFRDSRYYVIVIDSVPEILCSGYFAPVDETNLLNQIYRTSYQHSLNTKDQLTLTIMPYQGDKGIIVLSWYGKSRNNKEYIKALDKMNSRVLLNHMFLSVFQYMDNFYIRPSFWDNLSADKQESLHKRYESDVNPYLADSYKSVKSNNTNYVNWSVKDVRHNVW